MVRTHWQGEAADYDAVMASDPTMARLHSAILARVPEQTRTVLDLGCGTGTLLEALQSRLPSARLLGIDPASDMIEVARQRLQGPLVQLQEGSAHDLSFESESLDLVVSNFALHHLSHDDKRACAREIARVLCPGGRFVFGDQYVRRMGGPDDPDWLRDILSIFTDKAKYYLDAASPERMLLQVKLLPRFLTMDGELPVTVDFWLDALTTAGLSAERVVEIPPAHLMNRVIVADKPA